jgi:hypothetical protein
MHIWCPQCDGTQFHLFPKTVTTSYLDHMRCKNRACNYEFDIEWLSFDRSSWMNDNVDKYRVRRSPK